MTPSKPLLTALLWSVLFCCSLIATAQPVERLTGISGRPQPEAKPKWKSSFFKASLSLPFADDFSAAGAYPDPLLWADSGVYINQTIPAAPITLGAATFDGLDKFGRAYNLNRMLTDTTDQLTSRYINLSSPVDSVYLSFYWQPAGYGEPPSSMDSINLQFWNQRDTSWNYIWGVFGGDSLPFQRVMIPVDTTYHQDSFRFRFESYGAPGGNFDVWHIDQVLLDDERNFADTLVDDIAFTRPHPGLLNNYETVPWFHITSASNPQALAKNDLRLFYRRNVDPNAPRPSLFLGEYQIFTNGVLTDQNGAPDANLDDNHLPLVETRFPVPDTADAGRPRLDFLANSYSEETEILSVQTYSGSSQNRSANDTLRKALRLRNYYAYDDGSAERAYEIINNAGNFIVQRYDIFGSDTLKGLYLYFMPAAIDVDDNEFSIVVLENNNGLPGQVIFETDSLYVPQFSDRNFYLPYLIDGVENPPLLNSTVFIGIRQVNSTPLTLGYDANRRRKTVAFYGRTNDLFQSFLPGTIMMRPFFRYLPTDLKQDEMDYSKPQFEVYPNPSSGTFNLSWPTDLEKELFQYQVFDLRGQLKQKGPMQKNIELNVPAGLYLLQLINERSGESYPQRILIQ